MTLFVLLYKEGLSLCAPKSRAIVIPVDSEFFVSNLRMMGCLPIP